MEPFVLPDSLRAGAGAAEPTPAGARAPTSKTDLPDDADALGPVHLAPVGLGTAGNRIGLPQHEPEAADGIQALLSIGRLLAGSTPRITSRPQLKLPALSLLGPSRDVQQWFRRDTDSRSKEALSPELLAAASDARKRLVGRLLTSIDLDGAVRDECGSRILESALLLKLLQKENLLPEAQERLAGYLRNAKPDGELSAIIADAALGRGNPERASTYLASFTHDTGGRKTLLIRTLLALFGLVPFVDLLGAQSIHYMGFASWTEVTLCAIKLLRAHALKKDEPGSETDTDRAFLASRLVSAGSGRVYEGNLLAHLIALFALQTGGPGQPLLRDGALAMLRHQRSDGGVPFVTGQEIWVTALAGAALAGAGGDRSFLIPMADKVASWQLPDGGWGYSGDAAQTDVDDASRCVDFLTTVDPVRYADTIRRGEEYLVAMANPKTGGFPTYVRGHASDVDVTAGSVIALLPFWDRHAALLNKSVDYLLQEQAPDGSYPLAWTLSNCSVIGHVLDALRRIPAPAPPVAQRIARATHNGAHHINTAQNSDGGWGQQPGDPSDVLSTAHAIPPLARHGIPLSLHRGIQYLLSQQQADGGFAAPPDQVGPRPLAYDFPVLADVHALNALNAVLPPMEMPAGLSMPAVPARAPVTPGSGEPQKKDKDAEPVTVPALYCPIPPAIHPSADELQQRSNEWLDRFQLYASEAQRNRLKHTGNGILAARMCPNGRPELLQVKSDFNMWVVAFDDEYCDEGVLSDRPGEFIDAACRIHRVAEVTEMILDERERYGLALRDLRMRLDALASPEDGARFLEGLCASMMTEVRKSGYLARRQRPGMDDYTAIRLYMGAAMVSPVLAASVNGLRVPAAHFADRRVRALIEMAAFLTTWAPDLFSAGKDGARSPDGFGPIEAIQRDKLLRTGNPGTREEAQAEAVVLWERVMMRYLRLHERTLAGGPADLAEYIKGLHPYVRGSLDWCRETSRYRYENGVGGAEVMRAGELHDRPPGHSEEPVPIPAITWWWHVDENDPKPSPKQPPRSSR